WDIAQYKKEEWELQALALRLFAITPHSASCKHSFLILGWFYNQRHTNLTAERAEGMCKLYTFYITNTKQELPCYAVDIPENLLQINIDASEVYTLNIMNSIDIGLQIFNVDRKANDEIIISPRRQTIILDSQHNDFDIETLAKNMSMEIDNDEYS
ncbi:4321_t:CDS:2, partial [Cetraspora pellucida]